MIEKTTVRTSGVVLLVIANVLLIFSMLFSMYSGGRPNSGSGIGVLCVSSREDRFPESEYMSVFSGLGLKSSFYKTDSTEDEGLVRRIQSFARREDLDHVILVAYGETAGIALAATENAEWVNGLVLLMPGYDPAGTSDLILFRNPEVPIAIFDADRDETVQLYELLSGEDATISGDLSTPGPSSFSVRISPDAKTYISTKTMSGDATIDELFFPGLPDVQRSIAGYLTTYILADYADVSDVRGMIMLNQILKVLPLTMLVAGWFFFLSTISKPRSLKGVIPKEPVKESMTPKELSMVKKIERSEKYLFALLVPVSVMYGVALCVLMISVPHYAALAAALWPVISVGVASLFYLKHIRKMAAPEKVNRTRFLMSVFVSALFVLGVFLAVSLHVVSFRYFVAFPRVLLFVLPAVLLIVFLAACQKVDMFYTAYEKNVEHRRGVLSAWRFRGVILLPFVAMLVAAFLTMKAWLFLLSLYYIGLLIGADWFRKRVKRMSGTLFLPAVMSALLYVILAFI